MCSLTAGRSGTVAAVPVFFDTYVSASPLIFDSLTVRMSESLIPVYAPTMKTRRAISVSCVLTLTSSTASSSLRVRAIFTVSSGLTRFHSSFIASWVIGTFTPSSSL